MKQKTKKIPEPAQSVEKYKKKDSKRDLEAEDALESESESEELSEIFAEEVSLDPSEDEIISSLPVVASRVISDEIDEEGPGTRAISPNDPLKRYLEEIRRYPLLEPGEEYNLAIRLREQGDVSAARALVSANLRLVVKIAFEYKTIYSNVMDLIQEGNIGLMKAVAKFDPTKGAKLGYYSSWWIRSYILKYLLDNFRLVKVGTTQAQKKLFYHLMREKERLEAQGLVAGPKLLADKLNVREKDVVEMQQRLSGQGAEMSLDTPVNQDESQSSSHKDQLVDLREPADESLAKQELLRILQRKLPEFQKMLNEKEFRILNERLLAEEPKTLQEIADLYGLTRERTRQIEVKVIDKLRDFLKPSL
ncbi:MAG: RNA polymerase factor sigma-32 [Bdellovibrionia bacterium]